MTNEEAREHLKDILCDVPNDKCIDWIMALKQAIKALEQQSSEDCISRDEAIRIAEQGQIQGYEWQFKKLCDLPSVTPQQTRWIPVSERLPETYGIYLTYIVNPYDSQLSYIMLCDYIGQTWCPVDETASNNVVAWMPLPEPYRESEG